MSFFFFFWMGSDVVTVDERASKVWCLCLGFFRGWVMTACIALVSEHQLLLQRRDVLLDL